MGKTLVFALFAAGEKFAQSFDHGGEVEVVRLDHGGAGFEPGAIIDHGGVEIVKAEEHLDKRTVTVRLPQLQQDLRIGVVVQVDVGLHFEGVGVTQCILGVVKPDDDVGIDEMPRVGVGLSRRVDEHIPCIAAGHGDEPLRIGRGHIGLYGYRGGACTAAVGGIARNESRRRNAEYEHE